MKVTAIFVIPRSSPCYSSVSRRQLPSLLSLILLHTFLVPVDGSYLHCYPSFFSTLFYSVSRMQLPSLLSLVLLHTFLVRKTRDNNEDNCHLLALEKYGEERGITMKVTAVYWHYRKVWRRTRDNKWQFPSLLSLVLLHTFL
jgi:hypothetical protein